MAVETIVALGGAGRYRPSLLDEDRMQEVFAHLLPRSDVEAAADYLTTDTSGLKSCAKLATRPGSCNRAILIQPTGIEADREVHEATLGTNARLYPESLCPGEPLFPRCRNGVVGIQTAWGLAREIRGPPFECGPWVGDPTRNRVGQRRRQEKHRLDRGLPILCSSSQVKAGSPTLEAKAGGEPLATVIERYLVKARGQLDTTASLISSQHPALGSIPNDRPLLGLVVKRKLTM